MNKKDTVFVFGDGPSGLIAANYIQEFIDKNVMVFTVNSDGFSSVHTEEFKYKVAQRTMFYDKDLETFYQNVIKTDQYFMDVENLKNKIGVYFKDSIHNYPMQNNLGNLNWKDKVAFYWDYFNRKHSGLSDYYSWAIDNYGYWFAKNILLPHTWKTLKEDLQQINSASYGKKVLPLKLFGKENIFEFKNSDKIMETLRRNLDNNESIRRNVKIEQVDLRGHRFHFCDLCTGNGSWQDYETIINTIPATSIWDMLKPWEEGYDSSDTLEVAFNSLQWNNMLVTVFILPNNLINSNGYKILYFPEKKYLYSKVSINNNIGTGNGFGSIVCELSFRKNDLDKYRCRAYREKIMERVEDDLKRCRLISDSFLTIYQKDYRVISPAYIITDDDYKSSNDFIQSHCERFGFYNLGRFAQWAPNMRIEHSYKRVCEIMKRENLL